MRVKNWENFQHFKDRRPPWIKLYRGLLDDFEFHSLVPDDAKNLIMVWLIASEYDGCLPDDETLAFRLRIPEEDLRSSLLRLKNRGFLLEGDRVENESTPQSIASKNGFSSRYIKDSVKKEIRERDGNKCVSCSSTKNIEFDHIIPVSKGGSSEFDNIQLLCRSCNRAKRNKLVRSSQDLLSLETERETEKEREKRKRGRPTIEQAKAYFIKRGSDSSEAEKFYDHYESNGWKVGKNSMKDWEATIRNWIRRNEKKLTGAAKIGIPSKDKDYSSDGRTKL